MLDILGSLLGGALSFFGGQQQRKDQLRLAQQQMDMQREFAQQGITWRVEDAKRAGLHPLAALGASTASPSPVSVGDLSSPLSAMGQDVSRAFKAAQGYLERERGDEKEARRLQLEKGSLENEILRQELISKRARATQGGQLGPQMPAGRKTAVVIPGQGETVLLPQDAPEKRPHIQLGDGWRWRTDPRVSGAKEAEDRYGELSDYTAAPYALARDWYYNLQHNMSKAFGGVRQRFDTTTPLGRDIAFRRSRPGRH